MIVESAEFIHVELPFNSSFTHAGCARRSGDTIFVKLITQNGNTGYGEILPRSYITGETIDSIMGGTTSSGSSQSMAKAVLGNVFLNQESLVEWIESWLPNLKQVAALFGGIELALWSLMLQEHNVDFDLLLGQPRKTDRGRCLTIGFEIPTRELRRWAIHAKMVKANAIKMKLGRKDDLERIQTLGNVLPRTVVLRLDANQSYTSSKLEHLLSFCKGKYWIHSIEDPIDPSIGSNKDHLKALYKDFRIPFVIDENLITRDDAESCIAEECFQIVNLRIGKQGGLYATRVLRDLIESSPLQTLAGCMVGESRILLQASELLLSRSSGIEYVEGLQENEKLLAVNPVTTLRSIGPMHIYSLNSIPIIKTVTYKLE